MQKRLRKIYYRAYGLTDRGKVREINEDNFVINKDLNFFVVADGMGGLEKGELASKMAIAFSEKAVASFLISPRGEDTFTEDSFPPSNEEAMRRIVEKTNKAIYKKNLDLEKKMGTTFVCAKILDGKIYISNSGDSRCYHMSEGTMQRLTEDHSPAEEMIQSGRATGKEAELKKMMRYVKGALGLEVDVDPDVMTSIPKKGDIYLLCTDGLTKMLNDEKIAHIVSSEKDIQKACHCLVDLANELGGRDNITVVMIEIAGVDTSIPKATPKIFEEKTPHEDTFTD